MVLVVVEKTRSSSQDIAPAFSVTLLLQLFPLTTQSIVGYGLNTLSLLRNLLGSNGNVSGAVPDFMYYGTFDTSGGIMCIANIC